MKILLSLMHFETAGSTRLMLDIAKELRNDNHKIMLQSLFKRYKENLFDDAQKYPLRKIDWPEKTKFLCFKNNFYYLLYLTGNIYSALINSVDPSLSCVITELTAFEIVFQKIIDIVLNRKRVYFQYLHFPEKKTIENTLRQGSFAKRLFRNIIFFIEEKCFQSIDTIFVNSKFTQETFESVYPYTKTKTVVLYPSVLDSLSKTADISFEKECPIFLNISRFDNSKNQEFCVDVLKHYIENNKKQRAKLLMAGSITKYKKHIFQALRKKVTDNNLIATDYPDFSGDVVFITNFDDYVKLWLIKTADIFVFSAFEEHFGIVLLETMREGLPIVATNAGGPKEIVDDGQTGFLRKLDVKEFSDAIQTILKNPKMMERMRINSKRRFKENFSREIFAKTLKREITKAQKLNEGTVRTRRSNWIIMIFLVMIVVIIRNKY